VNPVVLQFANGNAFFVGMGMVVAALLLRLSLNGRFAGLALRIGYSTGIGLVIFSATPLSLWLYALWFGVCVVAAIVIFNARCSLRRKMALFGTTALISLVMCLEEFPYHCSPVITIPPDKSIFVVGDSISAGLGRNESPWPDLLGEISHLNVINLAEPGATVKSAIEQSTRITKSNSLVFVEIGGNDLLGRTDGKTFYVELDELLRMIKERNNQIVMFELPLPPFCNSFGYAQRSLAEEYNVTLIPKRYLTEALALKSGTLDGLHLSQKGHDALAESVDKLLKPN
jgi:acyl-CoA thioesterase-1